MKAVVALRFGCAFLILAVISVCNPSFAAATTSTQEHHLRLAKNSLHMQAHAIDIRIPGVDTLTLRNAALALGRGGVGYYPRSGFVHVDTGRVRTWCFGCSSSSANAE